MKCRHFKGLGLGQGRVHEIHVEGGCIEATMEVAAVHMPSLTGDCQQESQESHVWHFCMDGWGWTWGH
ncbi:unnamed protein product [Discosporangium mesarthrocarpum]